MAAEKAKAAAALASRRPKWELAGRGGQRVELGAGDCPGDEPGGRALEIKGCTGCEFVLGGGLQVIKLSVAGCKDCTVAVKGGAKIGTEVVEAWDNEDLTLEFHCRVSSLQLDLSRNVTLRFLKAEHLGYVVQAGVYGLGVSFREDPHLDAADLGFAALQRDHPGINDTTDQFITRVMDDYLLTEMVLRRADEYPTTAREERLAQEKWGKATKVSEDIVHQTLNSAVGDKLSANDKALLHEKLEAVKQNRDSEMDIKAVTDLERSVYKKQQGNELFQAKEYTQAAVAYTEALQFDPANHVCYSNRAACFLQTGHYDNALRDAEACLERDPKFVKGLFRKGLALSALERHGEAAAAFGAALNLDPKSAQIKSSLTMAQMKAARPQ